MARSDTPFAHRINGYLLLLDTLSGRWMITRRGNHVTSGFRSLEDAIAYVERRTAH